MTVSNPFIEHYQQPEVRDTILKLCRYGGGLRALNGDDGWYVHEGGKVRLRGPDDYNDTISRARSLYITGDVFEPEVFTKKVPWTVGRGSEGRPENPIGTRKDLLAYSLFADIDAVKDPDDPGGEDGNPRSKIYHEGRKVAVEEAARYLVGRLGEAGVYHAVRVAFSGQGIYVVLHPGLSARPDPAEGEEFDFDKLDHDYKVWLEAFNSFLADVERDFFEEHPEHVERVKIDKLNNQKRKLKSLLSIHRTLSFAVVPIDPADIKIDFDAAKIPLTNEMLGRAMSWVETWECTPDERHALAELLAPYAKKVAEEISSRAESSDEIRRLPFVPLDKWCPFCQRLLETGDVIGKHRRLGALAAWLYQAGWPEEAALDLWYPIAARADVETRIFFTSHGVINCPGCETIKRESSGYPSLGFGGLGLCTPDERCHGCRWPGDYGTAPVDAAEPTFTKEDFGYYETVKRKVKDEVTGKTEKVDEEVYKFSPTKAINSILERMDLCVTGFTRQDKDIYRFDGEIYRPDADSLIAVTLRRKCGDYAQSHQINEVTNGVLAELKRRPVALVPDPFLVPLQNGVADLRTSELRPYRAEDLFTFKYNASCDPRSGDWRLVLWQLCSTLPDPRDVLQAIDIVTSSALRVPFDSWVLLFGGGSNGKGNFEDMLAAFLGTERTSGMTLGELNGSRFGAGALLDVDLLIVSEVEGVKGATTAIKKLATGEFLDSDVKFGGRKKGRPHVLTILDANQAFDYGDDSFGRKRRTIKLDFPYEFGYEPHQRPKDPLMKEKITSPEALSGLAHIIMARAPYLIETRKIYRYKSTAETEAEYDIQRYPKNHFVENCIAVVDYNDADWKDRADGKDRLDVPDAVAEFKDYCQRFNVPISDDDKKIAMELGSYIAKVFEVRSTSTSRIANGETERYRYYSGLWLKKTAAEAHSDHVLRYSSTTPTTPLLHLDRIEIDISDYITTPTTPTTPNPVMEIITEICRMYLFIKSCKRPQEISWENYVEKGVVGVVGVVKGRSISVSKSEGVVGGVVETPEGVVEPPELCDKTLLVLEDVPTFVGLDGRTWTLAKGDIISGMLPLIHARNLVRKKLARVLEDEPHGNADYDPIAEILEKADQRQADFDAHFDTSSIVRTEPVQMMTATAEQAEALRSTATRLIANWPGITATQLGFKTYEVTGVSVPTATVEHWLKSEGWTRTGTKLNGSETWVNPDGWGEDDEVDGVDTRGGDL